MGVQRLRLDVAHHQIDVVEVRLVEELLQIEISSVRRALHVHQELAATGKFSFLCRLYFLEFHWVPDANHEVDHLAVVEAALKLLNIHYCLLTLIIFEMI